VVEGSCKYVEYLRFEVLTFVLTALHRTGGCKSCQNDRRNWMYSFCGPKERNRTGDMDFESLKVLLHRRILQLKY
jgi:hypothetical protein